MKPASVVDELGDSPICIALNAVVNASMHENDPQGPNTKLIAALNKEWERSGKLQFQATFAKTDKVADPTLTVFRQMQMENIKALEEEIAAGQQQQQPSKDDLTYTQIMNMVMP